MARRAKENAVRPAKETRSGDATRFARLVAPPFAGTAEERAATLESALQRSVERGMRQLLETISLRQRPSAAGHEEIVKSARAGK